MSSITSKKQQIYLSDSCQILLKQLEKALLEGDSEDVWSSIRTFIIELDSIRKEVKDKLSTKKILNKIFSIYSNILILRKQREEAKLMDATEIIAMKDKAILYNYQQLIDQVEFLKNFQVLKEDASQKIWINDHPKEIKVIPELTTNCSDTITLLKSFIDEPSRRNDRKAWSGFIEFIDLLEKVSSEYEFEDECAELKTIKNNIARLRTERNKDEKAGHSQDASKKQSVIQSNYEDSIVAIKEIQDKLTKSRD